MHKILHCGVLIAIEITLSLNSGVLRAGDIAISVAPPVYAGRNLAFDPIVLPQLEPSGARATSKSYQSLLLNCNKVDQARQSLSEAQRNGARQIPVAPGFGSSSVNAPSQDALYHIARNQERFNVLSQRFHCLAR